MSNFEKRCLNSNQCSTRVILSGFFFSLSFRDSLQATETIDRHDDSVSDACSARKVRAYTVSRHGDGLFMAHHVYTTELRTVEANYYLHRIWHTTNGLPSNSTCIYFVSGGSQLCRLGKPVVFLAAALNYYNAHRGQSALSRLKFYTNELMDRTFDRTRASACSIAYSCE